MEGDFSRNSDDPAASYSGVLMQQGRVQLDADWNEQWSIQTRALRLALRDLIGSHGGPATNLGFEVTRGADAGTLAVLPGVYYVDGIRCHQRHVTTLPLTGAPPGAYLVFLDVWERHVNCIEDPRTRDPALGGPDTASRAQVLWRPRLLRIDPGTSIVGDAAENRQRAAELVAELRGRRHRGLAARRHRASGELLSNALYRVEIHAGSVLDPSASEAPVRFTYKWSRDNGSVVVPIADLLVRGTGRGTLDVDVVLGARDAGHGLAKGDVVELVHDDATRGELDVAPIEQRGADPGRAGLLGRVDAIAPDGRVVHLSLFADDTAALPARPLRPYLRRWDHAAGARELVAGALPVRDRDLDTWLDLEHGVQIRFEADVLTADLAPTQRAGDHWTLPTRVVLGDILAAAPPTEDGVLPLRPPDGAMHHVAPLAVVVWSDGGVRQLTTTRRAFAELAVDG